MTQPGRGGGGSRALIGAVGLLGSVLALAVGGCGVTMNAEPQALPASAVPFDLLAPAHVPTPGVPVPQPSEVVEVFFVKDARLVAEVRQVGAPATLTEALEALAGGPTAAEEQLGVTTLVGAPAVVESGALARHRAVIGLGPDFAYLGGPRLIQALAQLVFTATGLAGVSAVSFELKGEPMQVPKGDGVLTDAPLTRSDYAGLAPSLP